VLGIITHFFWARYCAFWVSRLVLFYFLLFYGLFFSENNDIGKSREGGIYGVGCGGIGFLVIYLGFRNWLVEEGKRSAERRLGGYGSDGGGWYLVWFWFFSFSCLFL